MGLFDDSEEITVGSNIYHLVEPNPNAVLDSVLYSILTRSSLVHNILNVTIGQMSSQVGNMMAYAKESYTLGLPQTTYETTILLAEQDVIDAIVDDTDQPYGVVLEFHYIMPMVSINVVAPYLFTTRGWNPINNTISELPSAYQASGDFYYVGSVQSVELNDAYTQATIVYKIIKYSVQYTGDPAVPTQTYVSETTFQETVSVASGLIYGRDYCVACYRTLDSGGSPSASVHWWYYDISSGIYPDLTPESYIDEDDILMPVVPIRYENESMVTGKEYTELYQTSKTMMKKVGVDIEEIADTLESDSHIDDIDHAYITFGVDLQTDYVASIRYLAEFFDFLADKAQADVFNNIETAVSQNSDSVYETGVASYNTYTFIIGAELATSNQIDEVSWTASDGTTATAKTTSNSAIGKFEEYGLHFKITYSYIRTEIRQGSIGPIGHATKEWAKEATDDSLFGVLASLDSAYVIFRVQIAENTYKQITVQGLIHRNSIYDGHSVITTLSDLIDDPDNHQFIIPVHYNFSRQLPAVVRSVLYQDSLILVLNSYVVTEIPWYTATWFQVVIVIVGIVISIYTGGAGTWVAGLIVAAEAGVIAVLVYLFETILVMYAISLALEYVAKWVGPEAMLIITIATIALASMSEGGVFEVSSIASTMPTAGRLMALSCSMLASTNAGFQQEFEDLQEEYSDTLEDQTSLWKELEEAAELLPDPSETALKLLDAQVYSKTLKQPKVDSVENFYNLAIHSGNIGVLSLQGVATYFDLALRLPEADTKLGAQLKNTLY